MASRVHLVVCPFCLHCVETTVDVGNVLAMITIIRITHNVERVY